MSLPVNDKKSGNKNDKNQKSANNGSKFMKTSAKPAAKQKVRSTGANRGS